MHENRFSRRRRLIYLSDQVEGRSADDLPAPGDNAQSSFSKDSEDVPRWQGVTLIDRAQRASINKPGCPRCALFWAFSARRSRHSAPKQYLERTKYVTSYAAVVEASCGRTDEADEYSNFFQPKHQADGLMKPDSTSSVIEFVMFASTIESNGML